MENNNNVLMKRDPKSNMPLIASILILLAIVLIGIFFWNRFDRDGMRNDQYAPENIQTEQTPLSTSDDLSDIEADANATIIQDVE